MSIVFVRGGPEDSGPIGLVARFILAVAEDEWDAAEDLLTENSRVGFDLDAVAVTDATVSFEDVVVEFGDTVVPTLIEDEDGMEEMPYIIREEGGRQLIDYDASITRQMGVTMDDLGELLEMDDPDGGEVGGEDEV